MVEYDDDRERLGMAREKASVVILAVVGGLAWLCGALPAARAQSIPELRFTHLDRSDGLSDHSVEAIAKDPRGFMWFGTPDGLNRYDGYTFKVYRHDPQDPSSLSQNFVNGLLVDRQGTLWVSTFGGLSRYLPESDSFFRYHHDPEDPTSLSHDVIHHLHEGRDGALWVSTYWGLNRLDREREEFVRYSPEEQTLARTLSHPQIWVTHEDSSGNLWAGSDGGGLIRIDRRQGTVDTYPSGDGGPGFPGQSVVRDIHEDQNGNLWVGTFGGLRLFDRERGRYVRDYRFDPSDPWGPSSNHVDELFEDREGNLWIGYDGGGLGHFDPDSGRFTHHRHDPSDDSSLGSDVVRVVFEDDLGDLWVGTYTGGISFYNRHQAVFEHHRRRLNDPSSLADSRVLSFFGDTDGSLWIGTEGGLEHYDSKAGVFERFRHDPLDPEGLSADAVLSVHRDRQGDLWVGTFFGGLNRRVGNGPFRRYAYDPENPRSLGNPHVWDIDEDPDFGGGVGALWLATFGGVSRYDRTSDSFVRYAHDPTDPNGLGHNTVWKIHLDRSGDLWIGTQEGLSRYDRSLDRFHSYGGVEGCPGHVLTLFEDSSRRLWLGTEGNGLHRFDRPQERFVAYGVDDGLASAVVFGILEDDRGFLWLSTNAGISRFDPEDGTFENYDQSNGLAIRSFNKNTAWRSPEGHLYFGGMEGFIDFDPAAVSENAFVPPVVLTDFRIFDQPVPITTEGPLKRTITGVDEIQISHDQSMIGFGFSALSYRGPEKNRYTYRLEGFDRDWNAVGSRRTATYTNLDPGRYLFRVKASNNSGVWNDVGASLDLVVLPPFWGTWWFRGLSLLACVGLLLAVHALRTRSMRRHNQKLRGEVERRRRLEDERSQLLAAMESKQLDLEAKNAELERFSYSASHDLKTPLVTIRGFLGHLRRDLPELDDSVRGDRVRRDIERIESAADTMYALLEGLLELSRKGRVIGSPEPVPLTGLVDGVVELFDEGALGSVEILVQSDMPTAWGDRLRLFEVFQNLIANAIRFMGDQPSPRIQVEARQTDGLILCTVRDNGIGIEEEYQERVFELFERLDSSTEGTGVGLALVRRIVEVHGGRVWVESAGAGRGSMFSLTLPAEEPRTV